MGAKYIKKRRKVEDGPMTAGHRAIVTWRSWGEEEGLTVLQNASSDFWYNSGNEIQSLHIQCAA